MKYKIRGIQYRIFFILLFIVLLSLLTAVSCSCQKHFRVLEVPLNECVPNELFVDYIEQMKYLAMKDTSATGNEKRRTIIEIEKQINEIRSSLEEYRNNYGYGNCED